MEEGFGEASGRLYPLAILKHRSAGVESLQSGFVDKEKQRAATMIKLTLKLGMFYNTTWPISVRFVMGLTVTFKNKFF